jgi:hypothetical protein
MEDPAAHLVYDAHALLAAAQHLQRDAGDRSSATAVAPALLFVERALHALGGACENAAQSIIPAGDAHESTPLRLARAAADWPGAAVTSAPSYEEQVRLLSALHDAAAALRVAERRTAHAREVVASTVASGPDLRAAA